MESLLKMSCVSSMVGIKRIRMVYDMIESNVRCLRKCRNVGRFTYPHKVSENTHRAQINNIKRYERRNVGL